MRTAPEVNTPTAAPGDPGAPASVAYSPSGDQRDLRRVVNARAAYAERFGWPARVESGTGRVTVCSGEVVEGVAVPRALGEVVAHGLVTIMQPAAVIATSNGGWLLFLTTLRATTTPVPATLHHAGVRLLPHGTPIVLPVPGCPHGEARWVLAPAGDPPGVPDHAVVIALARRAHQALAAEQGRQTHGVR